MERRFLQNLDPLTETELKTLLEKRIFIAGGGGIGGYLAEYMLRLGIGEIALADEDRFEIGNLNRQLLCTEKTLGRYKAGAAARRAALISPGTRFTGHVCTLADNTLSGLIRGYDAVLDALDNVESRRALKAACDKEKIPYIFDAVSGWTAQAGFSLPGDGFLDVLFPEGYVEENAGVLSFTPALGAAMQAALCLRFLCGRPVVPGRLYSFDLQRMDFEQMIL